ncbi:DUF2917 domain-containing protein [Paraburkholderia sediminicola]|uniref:DUF2917 domain-containing protein n=1 Tax=Paraburkholderia sediminicola TaxID=458836 RepID=UPI0038BD2860
MRDARPQFGSDLPGCDPATETSSPKVATRLSLLPGQTVSWRVKANAEIRAHGSDVWLTRCLYPYDYRMRPGDVIRLARGERIWLATDRDVSTQVTLTDDCDWRTGICLAGGASAGWGWLSTFGRLPRRITLPVMMRYICDFAKFWNAK